VALNIGGADWQRNQVSLAYQAAQNVNNGLKLFYSFDFTEMACDSNDIIGRVNQFTGSTAQFKVDGKPLVGSFSGKCAEAGGLAFWQRVKSGTSGYLMPFLWELEGEFPNWYGTLDQWQWCVLSQIFTFRPLNLFQLRVRMATRKLCEERKILPLLRRIHSDCM